MRLNLCTWVEVEDYLQRSQAIIIPTGSTEQHGPMGLIGTDALCAEEIAIRVGERLSMLVAPTLVYTPAPFNMAFPGSISLSPATFERVVTEIVDGLASQGFERFYFLNGHGANLEYLTNVAEKIGSDKLSIRVRSWWDFEPVNRLRREFYGDWEGMHATPSEIAITQTTHRIVEPGVAAKLPEKLSADYIKAHSGDKHGAPDEHRRDFPDGRVGSHSALATPAQGKELLNSAVFAVTSDVQGWIED